MQLIFTQRVPLTDDISSFVFEPVEQITWLAGQSIRLELPALEYGVDERRFTISSAPYEHVITITTRRSPSDFKQTLFGLLPGTAINAYSIEGNFVWDQTIDRPLYVAAGIGITPFYAMLKQSIYETKSPHADLIYSNRDREAPFATDLSKWQKVYPQLAVQYLLGARITATLLEQYIPDLAQRAIYLSGPSSFVDTLRADLITDFQLAASSIRSDWFTGKLLFEG